MNSQTKKPLLTSFIMLGGVGTEVFVAERNIKVQMVTS